ncbi:uncharacterized protein LTR77_005105 [Saxophila tyrrhenica]|uniref:histidine kinase n=1 Tax=Saxophila tyrrhenica TaxID=1690608 RepID=A0AAV9PB28_9PEZI|nr:hypothetical protein LTR77_005105 [Saxophila tyrrhenica]
MTPGAGGEEYRCPLPAEHEDVWKASPLGTPSKWPTSLQAHAQTAASFPYPAAVFWKARLILLANSAWCNAAARKGVQQGQPQRGRLGADAWHAVDTALHGGEPKRIESRHFLEDGEVHTVLLSPLFGDANDGAKAVGVLAQLLTGQKSGSKIQANYDTDREIEESHAKPSDHHVLNMSKLGQSGDKVPLDQHPFFHRFAEMLPSGLAILDPKANAIFVNQQFYELTTHQGDDQDFKAWPQSIHPDDYDRVMEAYQNAFDSQKQLRTEFRALGQKHPWRLLLLMPLGDENLEHVSLREYGGFVCSIVDITSEKSAELAEREAAKEALERKGQQEKFIDMISHEIRNPLSAIVHCAEDIEEALKGNDTITSVGQIRESLETIHLCLQHQRNIVDDVLSFSKLDASMLLLRPKACRPSRQLASTMKMFHPEFRKQKMGFDYRVDDAYKDCSVEQVMADESRIGQVLVNLLSNAIKFTARKDGEKKIQVRIAASYSSPASYPPDVVFFKPPETAKRMDMTEQADWGEGDPLYIMVAVKDTGIGINNEGQKRLFERFHQATPKTEANYGGSGLGLNICRKICQLHGGEIGVSSVEGEGSTFGFFFKVRRCGLDNMSNSTHESEDASEESTQSEDAQPEEDIKVPNRAPPGELNTETSAQSLNTMYLEERSKSQPSATQEVPDRQEEKSAQQENAGSGAKLDGAGEAANTEASRAASPSSRQTHVLLVEDNIINQKVLRRKFEARDFRVTTANNGREAVEAVKAIGADGTALDIILMDEHMPVLDGSSATRQIRQMEQKGEVAKVPILGLTANVRTEQTDAMIESGMDDVISKPYKTEEMVDRLERLVKRNSVGGGEGGKGQEG